MLNFGSFANVILRQGQTVILFDIIKHPLAQDVNQSNLRSIKLLFLGSSVIAVLSTNLYFYIQIFSLNLTNIWIQFARKKAESRNILAKA